MYESGNNQDFLINHWDSKDEIVSLPFVGKPVIL